MSHDISQAEFWEASFGQKRAMWGLEPARSAVLANDLFVRQAVGSVLVPGMGYGRNAQLFRQHGMRVTGIEIAQTAIDLARQQYGPDLRIYHGSVLDMPFDADLYDGIFCHALLHLFDHAERQQLIQACSRQLAAGGYMVFSVIAKTASTYGQGQFISPDRYELFAGAPVYFYDEPAIRAEFGAAGLLEIKAVDEKQPFWLITCQREVSAPLGGAAE